MFDENELSQINSEVNSFIEMDVQNNNDPHHNQLFRENRTTSFALDDIYFDKRDDSNILKLIKKVYGMYRSGTLTPNQNPFLKYIPVSNADVTFLQLYKANSSYFEHDDLSVLTFLYPFKMNSAGGNLIFTEYDYTPYLVDNCCLIFPSFERHRLTPVEFHKKDTVARFSINQRIYIK